MKRRLYNIRFPVSEPHQLQQDEAFFYLKENNQELTFRVHEYGEIYKRPGLYEQLFYQRLKCQSPKKVCSVLGKVLADNHAELSELRVLDLGAGNGMVGEILQTARVIGINISHEAYSACERDRPGIYDAYYVAEVWNGEAMTLQQLNDGQIDCMTCVAALGLGGIATEGC